jgi:Uma2 family endonuclease
MAALPSLLTVAQFRELPEGGEFEYELHHGEVVALTRPKARHYSMQVHLQDLLAPKLRNFGRVVIEMPYRPLAEFELRAADVAAVSHARWQAIDPEDNLRGAPDLVIEIKSPSNTRKQLQELVTLCLANGAMECWVLNSVTPCVTVARRDGSVTEYRPGQAIPLESFGEDELLVSSIFSL